MKADEEEVRNTRSDFASYNAAEFYRALDAGHIYPEAWIHLATWWRVTGAAPEWPPRPPDYQYRRPL